MELNEIPEIVHQCPDLKTKQNKKTTKVCCQALVALPLALGRQWQVDLLSPRPIWSIQQVPEQPGIHRKKPSLGVGMGTCQQSLKKETMLNVKQAPRCTFAPCHCQA